MIYYLLRPIVRFALKLYFGKIYISGLENIPLDKPIILASNHPTAFIEPCMLACFLPVKLHFLVRGDLFSKAWLSWLLVGTNQIPIFRQKDGLDNVRKNLITQQHIEKLFKGNNALLMFPEAHTHENIYLRPLKKGISRFAFMQEDQEVHVIPIGVNFDKNVRFASKVSLVIGSGINIQEFIGRGFETEALKHKVFLEELSAKMKKCLRHIEHEEREDVIQEAYKMMDSSRRFQVIPMVEKSDQVFREEKELATQVDRNLGYFESLRKELETVRINRYKAPNAVDFIFMFLLLPVFAISVLFHIIPVQISRFIVFKKIKAHEFKSPVFLAMMILQYVIFILIAFIGLLSLNFTWVKFWLLFFGSGIFGVYYLRMFQDKWKYLFLSKSAKEKVNHLVDLLVR